YSASNLAQRRNGLVILPAVFDYELQVTQEFLLHRLAVVGVFSKDDLDIVLAFDFFELGIHDASAVHVVIDPGFDGGAGLAEHFKERSVAESGLAGWRKLS